MNYKAYFPKGEPAAVAAADVLALVNAYEVYIAALTTCKDDEVTAAAGDELGVVLTNLGISV